MTKLFVAMPFAEEFTPVYAAIKGAAARTGLQTLRVDETPEPGPIINQITRELANSDFVIAEVSSQNPNVYYEVGLAHCSRKPTVLLATKSSLRNLPFDIRHNRVIGYDKRKKSDLEDSIARHLCFLIDHHGGKISPSREAYFTTLSDGRQTEEEVISSYIKQVAREFELQNARLRESRWSPDEGYVLTVEDAFQEQVVFSVDINGRILRKKRLA
jgi:hypothetical protein